MTNGYDGSMMNGLQTLELWQEYFNEPKGSLLGIFNAIQVCVSVLGRDNELTWVLVHRWYLRSSLRCLRL